MRPTNEVADIFRAAGPAYRAAHAGHLSLDQLKVMSAIETCRTAALGGHVEACSNCGHRRIAYNSCRNRHCPRCQGAAARTWLEAQEAILLPVGYFHVVFTLPAEIADIALHNKRQVYDLLFKVASETMLTIAADPKHLGARIGMNNIAFACLRGVLHELRARLSVADIARCGNHLPAVQRGVFFQDWVPGEPVPTPDMKTFEAALAQRLLPHVQMPEAITADMLWVINTESELFDAGELRNLLPEPLQIAWDKV